MVNITDYKGVWVFAEQRQGKLLNVALELLGEGRKIAAERKTELTAVILGKNVSEMANTLIKYGADRVLSVDHNLLENYTTDAYAKIIAQLAQERKPEILLIGATNVGRDLAPRISIKLNTGLTADCTRLEVDTETGNLLQTRPAFGGNLMATIITPEHRPQMATVRPGVMVKAAIDEKRKGQIEKIEVKLSDTDILAKLLKVIKAEKEAVNLAEAEIIVAGGRGLCKAEGFDLLKQLANKLGGVLGCSRAAEERGWIPHEHLVGQTGTTVRPKLYIACGISGAMQHLVGMQGAECIVAINKDPDAPIFKIAHYGLVGDLYKIIPELIRALDNLDRGL